MPILLTYSPTYAGAQAAENVGDERQRQIRAQEALRRQQAYEEQRRYDEQMQEKQRQDFINNLFRSRQLDNEEQRNAELSFYRDQALGQRAQLAGESDAEKFRRLKERLASQGDMQGARIAAQREQQARQQTFSGNQNDLNRAGQNDRFNQGLEQRRTEEQNRTDRFGQSLDNRRAEEEGRNTRARIAQEARQQAIDKRDAAHNALMNARDAQTRARAHIDLADSQHTLARQDLNDWEEKYRREKIGDADWQTRSYWEGEHQRLQKVEYEAQKALVDAKRAMFEPVAPQPQSGGVNMNFRRDTPASFQNDPLQEGPIIGGGGASGPMGQSDDVMGEFNAAPANPQMAQFIQYYNSLAPGTPYTAPDGTQRVKQ